MRMFALLLTALGAVGVAQASKACEFCDTHNARATSAPASSADLETAQTQSAPQALTVVRDPETGALRAPTATELAALQAKARMAAKTAPKPLVRAYASGAHSARLPSDLASYSVATRLADGSISSDCVQGADSAGQAILPVQPAQPALSVRPQAVRKDAQ